MFLLTFPSGILFGISFDIFHSPPVTCQVRVVRFYKSCLLLLVLLLRVVLLFTVILAIIFASCILQWAAPDLNCKLQIGQRRTSTGELPSGVGSAGPQLPEENDRKFVTIECQKICQKRTSEATSMEMSDNLSENNVKKIPIEMSQNMSEKNVRQECQKILQ